MKTSIQSRLLLFLIVSYVPVALIILWNNQIQHQQAQQVVQNNALQQARDIAFFHRQQIEELEDILLLMAQSPALQEWDMDYCRQMVNPIVSQFPNWYSMSLMDAEGTIRCSNRPETIGANYADRPFVQEVLQTGEAAVSDYIIGRISARPFFFVARPIFDAHGAIQGIISVGIVPDTQSELIATEILQPDYRMTIIDRSNTVLMAYPEPERWIGNQYPDSLLEHIGQRSEGTFEAIGLDGRLRLFGFTRLDPIAAIATVSIDKSIAFTDVYHIQQRNLLLLTLTFSITTFLIILASRLVAHPLHQLSLVTQQFAQGELGKRISIHSDIQEIMRIQKAFNDMAHSIEARIEARTGALTKANEQLVAEIQTRQEVEAELERFTARLRDSNRDLEQFAYVASHDLREPLRKIIAFSERLQRDTLSHEQRQDYLKRVYNTATRMTGLIDNLLFYARIDQQETTQTSVNLSLVAQQVVSDLDELLTETQGSVLIDQLPTIHADKMQMHSLFQNLIANALKYHQETVPPVVRLSAQEVDETLEIRITDNGVGIPEKDVDRIFTIFERLHGRSQGGGSGIGLAICRKIMQRHQGDIRVESTVGVGTSFILQFPRSIKV